MTQHAPQPQHFIDLVVATAEQNQLEVNQVGPIMHASLKAVRIAAAANQTVSVAHLVKVLPRPPEPVKQRPSLQVVAAAGLIDAVAGTVHEEIAGGWKPDKAVRTAELVQVVAEECHLSQRLVKRALAGFEAALAEAVAAGTPVRIKGFATFTPWARRPVRRPTAALVSVALGPLLEKAADTLEHNRETDP